jgi:hypothetical protein
MGEELKAKWLNDAFCFGLSRLYPHAAGSADPADLVVPKDQDAGEFRITSGTGTNEVKTCNRPVINERRAHILFGTQIASNIHI